mmetsp:Transcript_37060/g.93983  ORF Transcript_37060/g.93983 Transcript_37060/m.93983 type:complete len:378 (+) Transcript_37060:95-1228(+)
MDPSMVDERMRAAWGRRYTPQDTEDYIERSTQMLAKMGHTDSSVVNADKAEQPGTGQTDAAITLVRSRWEPCLGTGVPLLVAVDAPQFRLDEAGNVLPIGGDAMTFATQTSGDVAHPEELVMPPEETRADIEEHVRRLAPPAEFLQRGKELIGTQRRGGLRWPGQRSFCKVVGQSLGGLDASGAWRWLEADRDARAIVASRFVEEHRSGVPETRLVYVAGGDQLLDPRQPQRWGLLRAVADELNTHAAKSEDVHLDQATRDYHLGACWAWDVWGADHSGDLVWVILQLCALIISFGTAARSYLFPPLTIRDEACPITLACFREGYVATFRSLHPCMHWVREEGYQGLRTLLVETGEQFTCPLCRHPVNFARKYKRGA